MVNFDNPAGRLHGILAAVVAHPDAVGRRVWATVFDIDINDYVSLSERLALTIGLPAQAAAAIDALELDDDSREYVLRWHDRVRTGLAEAMANLNTSITAVTSHMQNEVLYSLEGCARKLYEAAPTRGLDDVGLVELRETLDVFRSELVAAADLPVPIREQMLRHVAAMAHALDLVQLIGADGLIDRIDQIVGASIRVYSAAATPAEQTWYEKLHGLVLKFGQYAGLAKTSYEIAGGFIPGLPALPGPGGN